MKKTQCDRIIEYMKTNNRKATVREIFVKLNINSPTKRMSELAAMGLVESEIIYENGTHYAVYYLK